MQPDHIDAALVDFGVLKLARRVLRGYKPSPGPWPTE
jgi:hypothetical protein